MRRRQFLYALAGSPLLAAPARAEPDFADERWPDAARPGRTLPVRLRWPGGQAPCGIVVYSHGLGGNRAGGSAWGEAWQAAGLAVLHLQHPGSDTDTVREGGLAALRRGAAAQQYLQRIADARFALDELARRQAQGGRWGRLKLDAIGFAGHSFGARLTQALAGERPPRAPRAAAERIADPRPRAFIAFSPGFSASDGLDDASLRRRFAAITRPFLCVTGTHDEAMSVGDASNAARRAVYRGLPAGAKAELVLAGADHMTFGGGDGLAERPGRLRLLRRADGAPELEAVHRRVVAALTADWWRWHLLGDEAARERLRRPAGLAAQDVWQLG
jgi:dienelactone hydrolase